MKYIFWFIVALLWSIPEVIYSLTYEKPTKVAQFIVNKLNL
jgi:hypothetical protein